MPRTLADASSLIALAEVGELDLLRDALGEVTVPETVLDEAVAPDTAGADALRDAVDAGWIEVLPDPDQEGTADPLGLDPGEASLFQLAQPGDALLLDEREARRFADASGFPYTGVLGLVVGAVRAGRVGPERGSAVVRKLARSDFRMTTALYDWALEEIGEPRS